MDTTLKTAAICANLSLLCTTLACALQRAEEAKDAIGQGEINQAIGAALSLFERMIKPRYDRVAKPAAGAAESAESIAT